MVPQALGGRGTLRIAVVAHVRHPVRAPFMGGMEAHAAHLTAALVARGHDVTLFAAGDSDAALPVHPLLPEHYDRVYPWHDYHGTETLNRHLDAAFAIAARDLLEGGYDVMHNNSLHRFPPRLSRAYRLPAVTSLHVPPFVPLDHAVPDSTAPWHRITATSAAHLAMWWPGGAPDTAAVVANGIDPGAWPYVAQGDGAAVWSGRITPTKGTHLAIAAANRAGLALTICGAIEDRGYFDAHVAPALGAGIRYAGHLSGAALAAELGRASVLLFTPVWDEPFGLAAIEAMACGVPVAALQRGGVREVVGPCGRYAATAEALAQAAVAAMALPRAACRQRVLDRFTIRRMVDRYEALYAAAIAARDAPALPVDYAPITLTVA